MSTFEYVEKVETSFKKEQQMCDLYYKQSTNKIINMLQNLLIEQQITHIINDINIMIEKIQYNEIKQIYLLIKRIDNMTHLLAK